IAERDEYIKSQVAVIGERDEWILKLEEEIHDLRYPGVILLVGATDIRTDGTPRLWITGEVRNIGIKDVANVRLNVTLYQGDVVANQTFIEVGYIPAGSNSLVHENVFYAGEVLTDWDITVADYVVPW
ncbi:MAG: hypothetical protein QCH99_09325, partial [Candidatus Bathyarchaeota archaeon]|nr:hypothetical protein [Candidatus Bathyarchaeum tardum]